MKERNEILRVETLQKTYGKGADAFSALRGVTLGIEQGESLAIVGKSGSGKSTLMHLLALLDSPTTGKVLVNGENAKDMSKREIDSLRGDKFGFVFQQFFVNPNETVLENVALPLKIAGVPAKERRQKAMAALKEVGLERKAKNKAADLSGGQKQRVCVARAIVNEPSVIFADEPTGNLDSVTGEKIVDLLFGFNKKKKATLIIVTHDNDLAKKCKRQIKMKDGRIV
ncbi:ABC transporter ATP-binding protein [Candidatus Saccharibacteria bacterium]|nr:ABC transporter ATP-binding protein [Candidatus Saccharibacteria bacterium]